MQNADDNSLECMRTGKSKQDDKSTERRQDKTVHDSKRLTNQAPSKDQPSDNESDRENLIDINDL